MTRLKKIPDYAYRHPAVTAHTVVLIILCATSRYNYLLFHSLAEIYSIVIAFATFLFAWNTRRFLDNDYIFFLGIGFLFVGGIDLLHTLGYKGMGIFQRSDSNLATELWIAGRYTQAFTFLIAPFFFRRKVEAPWLFAGFSASTGLFLLLIFGWDVFPDCFVEGHGQTFFKIASEAVICLLLLASAAFLFRNRKNLDQQMYRFLTAAIFLAVIAEITFTLYEDVYGISNLIGHLLKILSFYMVYRAIIVTGLKNPVSALFRNLKAGEAELRAHSERLEDLVGERTAELARINRELRNQVMERQMAEMSLRNSERELKILSKKLMKAEEKERQRIAAELHDSIGQALSAIKFGIENATEKIEEQGICRHTESLRALVPIIQKTIEEVRRIVMDLRPSILDDLGILATIDWFCREYQKVYGNIRIEKDIEIMESDMDPEWKTILYRILQEALNNVAKHSHADRVQLGLKRIGIFYELRIADNGRGFALDRVERDDQLRPGFGLASMRERAEAMGGTFLVSTEAGRGTIVCLRWPVAKPESPGQTGRSFSPVANRLLQERKTS